MSSRRQPEPKTQLMESTDSKKAWCVTTYETPVSQLKIVVTRKAADQLFSFQVSGCLTLTQGIDIQSGENNILQPLQNNKRGNEHLPLKQPMLRATGQTFVFVLKVVSSKIRRATKSPSRSFSEGRVGFVESLLQQAISSLALCSSPFQNRSLLAVNTC